MTFLIVPVSGELVDDVRSQIESALSAGADAIELRLDLIGELSADELRTLRTTTPADVPFILTLRSAGEGGQWDGGDDDRVSRLIELGPFVNYIDVELALWRRSANIRQKIELALHRADPEYAAGGEDASSFVARRKLILSKHDFSARPSTLQKDLVEMLSEPTCDVPKIAWRARTIRDNFEALELTRESSKPAMLICMGNDGLMSRVLARKFGAFGTFVALERGLETASGQPTIDQLKGQFHWDGIGPQTRVFGVIGDPVAHSISPAVHQAAFDQANYDAVYLPMRVAPGYESFKAFMVEVLARRWLGMRGFSITIPHKENALRFLRESGGKVDPNAQLIGAINTISINEDGSVAGYNTDYDGVIACLDVIRFGGVESGGSLRATVLGAGGVARAVVAALKSRNAQITIFNRTPERAEALAREFDCRAEAWEQRGDSSPDLLVNCTSMGMEPRTEESPMPRSALQKNTVVFDTVYRPAKTALLRDAETVGCATVGGLKMFSHQAAAQFRVWTGLEAPAKVYDSQSFASLLE